MRGAFRRSFELVRGHFWIVAAVLIPIELVGDALTEAARRASSTSSLGHALLAVWLGESVSQHRLPAGLRGRGRAAHPRPDPPTATDGAGCAASTLPAPDPRMTALSASIVSDFWNDHLVDHDRQGVFLVLVGFILSFAFIRMSTRLMRSAKVPWWPGSVVSDSGVHLHHLVFGIVTMMIAGTLGFAALGHSPCAEICAFFFGVGAGLTIDEFALWVYLDDVYWAEEGRSSIDATVIAAAADRADRARRQPARRRHRIGEAWSERSPPADPRLRSVAICFLKGRQPARDRSASSSSRSRSTAPAGSASRTRPGRGAATASGGRRSRRRPRRASHPTAAPSASRKPSATSSAASRARASRRGRNEAVAATREAGEEVRAAAERVAHPDDDDREREQPKHRRVFGPSTRGGASRAARTVGPLVVDDAEVGAVALADVGDDHVLAHDPLELGRQRGHRRRASARCGRRS